jgi:two-component system, NarL family, nitrate/nitrite response regulator NarL
MGVGSSSIAAARPSDKRGRNLAGETATLVFVLATIRLYREGVAQAFAEDERFAVLGTAADGAEGLRRIEALRPDVVLVDTTIPACRSLVTAIREGSPATRIVALGVADDVAEVMPLAEAGVTGWVGRDASVDDLLSVTAIAARNEAICSPQMTGNLLRRLATLAAERRFAPGAGNLTVRERQIADLIDEGLSNKEIAARLSIELPTVKSHVHNILEKLHVTRRGQIAALLRGLPGINPSAPNPAAAD